MLIPINKRGVTLIELMIAMIITGVIMASLTGLLNSQRRGYMSQQAKAECEESVSRVHGELLDKIRIAGYMIPHSFVPIQPYYVASGPDSVKVTGNYDNFIEKSVLNFSHGSDVVYTKASPRFRYTPGMKLMIQSPPADTIYTFWSEVDTAVQFTFFGTKYIAFSLEDTATADFPAGSRVSTFNEYVFKVGFDTSGDDTLGYFGVRVNDATAMVRLVDGIEDITLTYETRTDTTDHVTFPADSLKYIYAVNLDIVSRSITSDAKYTDPVYGDHYKRSELSSQVVVLNVALAKK